MSKFIIDRVNKTQLRSAIDLSTLSSFSLVEEDNLLVKLAIVETTSTAGITEPFDIQAYTAKMAVGIPGQTSLFQANLTGIESNIPTLINDVLDLKAESYLSGDVVLSTNNKSINPTRSNATNIANLIDAFGADSVVKKEEGIYVINGATLSPTIEVSGYTTLTFLTGNIYADPDVVATYVAQADPQQLFVQIQTDDANGNEETIFYNPAFVERAILDNPVVLPEGGSTFLTIATGDVRYLLKDNNLSDVADAEVARQNLQIKESLAELNTVDFTTQPTVGQVLTFDGTNWIADDASSGSSSFSGDYDDLTNKPTLFSGDYVDLSNKPTLFSEDYDDLTNKPTLFSGDYVDLSNKPTLFSEDYDDLTNKPTLITDLGGLSSVDLITNTPTNGQTLTFDGTNWVPVTPTTSTGSTGSTTLDGLTDTSFGTLVSGNFLKFDGTNWVNQTLQSTDIPALSTTKITSGVFSVDRLPDVSETSAGIVPAHTVETYTQTLEIAPSGAATWVEKLATSGGSGGGFLDKASLFRNNVLVAQYDTIADANTNMLDGDNLVIGLQTSHETAFGNSANSAQYSNVHHVVPTTYTTTTNGVPALDVPDYSSTTEINSISGGFNILIQAGTYTSELLGFRIASFESEAFVELNDVKFEDMTNTNISFSNSHAMIRVDSVNSGRNINLQLTGSQEVTEYVNLIDADGWTEFGGLHVRGGLVTASGTTPSASRSGINVFGGSTIRDMNYLVGYGRFMSRSQDATHDNVSKAYNCKIICDSPSEGCELINCEITTSTITGSVSTFKRTRYVNCTITSDVITTFSARYITLKDCTIIRTSTSAMTLNSNTALINCSIIDDNSGTHTLALNGGLVIGNLFIETDKTYSVNNSANFDDTNLRSGHIYANKAQNITSSSTLTNFTLDVNLEYL